MRTVGSLVLILTLIRCTSDTGLSFGVKSQPVKVPSIEGYVVIQVGISSTDIYNSTSNVKLALNNDQKSYVSYDKWFKDDVLLLATQPSDTRLFSAAHLFSGYDALKKMDYNGDECINEKDSLNASGLKISDLRVIKTKLSGSGEVLLDADFGYVPLSSLGDKLGQSLKITCIEIKTVPQFKKTCQCRG